MPSIKDVAKISGVSKSSVSRVLNNSGYVSEDVRQRVLATVKKLNYSPNQIARSLKMNRSGIVALFVPTVFHPFFSKVSFWIEKILYANGYKTLIVNSQDSQDKEKTLLQMIEQNQVDGIIFITHHVYEKIDESIPIVTIDRHFGSAIPFVTSDNYDATLKAIEYLIDLGCRHVGFIGGRPKVESEVEQRFTAYKHAMNKHQREHIVSYEDFKHGEEMGYAIDFLRKHPQLDGVFASGDTMAFNIFQVAQNMGIKVPEQLKIIAYDGVINDWIKAPCLTSCRQNIEKMAEATVMQLLLRIRGLPSQQITIIPTDFVKGDTA